MIKVKMRGLQRNLERIGKDIEVASEKASIKVDPNDPEDIRRGVSKWKREVKRALANRRS